MWPSLARVAQCTQLLDLAFQATLRKLCPSDSPKQHHLYANAGCHPGGASWEPSQVCAMLLGRGPRASSVSKGLAGAGLQWGPEQLSSTLSRGGPSRLPRAPLI